MTSINSLKKCKVWAILVPQQSLPYVQRLLNQRMCMQVKNRRTFSTKISVYTENNKR